MPEKQLSYKYKSIIKPKLDLACVILLSLISLVGCFSVPSFDIYFAIIYIASYFLFKEVYNALITKKREKAFMLALQSKIEKTVRFNNLFEYIKSEDEKLKSKTKWLIKCNEESNYIIGIFLNNKRLYFRFKNLKNSQSVNYIINQLYKYAPRIKDEDDLKKLVFFVIKDGETALNWGNAFISHELNESIYSPFLFNDDFFNSTMMTGYVSIYVLAVLIKTWAEITIVGKILWVILTIILAIPFVLGMIVIMWAMFDSLMCGLRKHKSN